MLLVQSCHGDEAQGLEMMAARVWRVKTIGIWLPSWKTLRQASAAMRQAIMAEGK